MNRIKWNYKTTYNHARKCLMCGKTIKAGQPVWHISPAGTMTAICQECKEAAENDK